MKKTRGHYGWHCKRILPNDIRLLLIPISTVVLVLVGIWVYIGVEKSTIATFARPGIAKQLNIEPHEIVFGHIDTNGNILSYFNANQTWNVTYTVPNTQGGWCVVQRVNGKLEGPDFFTAG